jgi:hypothetical protein
MIYMRGPLIVRGIPSDFVGCLLDYVTYIFPLQLLIRLIQTTGVISMHLPRGYEVCNGWLDEGMVRSHVRRFEGSCGVRMKLNFHGLAPTLSCNPGTCNGGGWYRSGGCGRLNEI